MRSRSYLSEPAALLKPVAHSVPAPAAATAAIAEAAQRLLTRLHQPLGIAQGACQQSLAQPLRKLGLLLPAALATTTP